MNTKPSPVIRLMPSLTDVAFLLPVVFHLMTDRGINRLLSDGDTGWHLRTGEWMMTNGAVPSADMFSYTKSGEPWYAWEWGWDLVFGWMHRAFGMPAVVLASMGLICLMSAFLFRLVRRRCPNTLLAFAVSMLAVAGTSLHWLARPHLVTMLFVVAFLWILENAREGETRRLYLLPLLTIPWVNLHGGFFVGIVLIGCYAAGEFARALIEPDTEMRAASVRRGTPFVFTALGCAAASFLNPYTYQLHQHIYGYLTESYHMQNIGEFQSVSFQNPSAVYFEIMIGLAGLAILASLRKRRFEYVFLLAGWMHLSLISARNIPLFVIVAAPIVGLTFYELMMELREARLARWVRSAVDGMEEFAGEIGETDRIGRVHLVSAFSIALLALIVYTPNMPVKLMAYYATDQYPAAAVEALEQIGGEAKVFSDDEWGDYLIYSRYPAGKVYIDGRSDFYGPEFGEAFLRVMAVGYGWEDTLAREGVEFALIRPDAALAGALKESGRWSVEYDDGRALIFRRLGAEKTPGDRRLAQAAPERRDSAVLRGGMNGM